VNQALSYLFAVLLCASGFSQEISAKELIEAPSLQATFVRVNFDLYGDSKASPGSSAGSEVAEPLATVPLPDSDIILIEPGPLPEIKPNSIDWTRTAEQSFFFLSIQHATRIVQKKTRPELKGKLFDEWANAVDGLGGWGDGDSILTNYVGHPMMGAISGWILIQNDPHGIDKEFDVRDMKYWNSRFRAMGWATFYSTQFELGPVSEATIGHVGKIRGTAGAVDLVMTPVGGFGWIVAEDAVDKHLVRKLEDGHSDGYKRFVRTFFNPNRSVANVLRLKKPWYRDVRPMSSDK
jgi:hypothetical protein